MEVGLKRGDLKTPRYNIRNLHGGTRCGVFFSVKFARRLPIGGPNTYHLLENG